VVGYIGLVGPQDQHAPVAHAKMKPVLGEDGHRHFFGQEIEGVRDGRLPAERFDREIQTSFPRHRRRPGPRGVHDLPGGNVAAGGTHRRDPAHPV
jgi:hypothetical protein